MSPLASVQLAFRFLFGRRENSSYRRVRGGIIGVGLSLIPLIVVLQVADGMIAGITERYLEAGSFHIQGSARDTPDDSELEETIVELSGLPGVNLATVERTGLGLAASGTTRTAVTIRAVEPDLWERDPSMRTYLSFTAGEWMLDERGILLGESVARELDAAVGDTVQVLTARTLSGGRIVPRTRRVIVRGIVTTGYADLDRLWVFLPYAEGSRLLPDETSETLIGLKISDPLSLPNPLFRPAGRAAGEQATALLDSVRETIGQEYRVSTWFESERPTYMSFKTTRDLLIFIMILIVIVAAVNISSALVMLVLEKQEEIAIIKSFGASPQGIVTTFVLAGMVLGALGTLVGVSLGLLIAVNINEVLCFVESAINLAVAVAGRVAAVFGGGPVAPVELLSSEYYLQEIPIRIRLGDVTLVSVLSIFLAAVAAWFPARRAGRVRPLEVLRRH